MDFSAQLDQLQQRAAQAKQAAQAAASESREQRRQRIDQAKVDVDHAAKDAQQEQSAAAASARGKWAQLKADAAAKMDDLQAKMDKRADQLDARIAANQADGPRPTPRTPSTLPPGRWTACGWRCWDAIDAPPTPTSSSGQRAPSLHRRHRATTTV